MMLLRSAVAHEHQTCSVAFQKSEWVVRSAFPESILCCTMQDDLQVLTLHAG